MTAGKLQNLQLREMLVNNVRLSH